MIRFMKVPPTTYVLQYKHGKIKREGAGLSFIYWAPTKKHRRRGRIMELPLP